MNGTKALLCACLLTTAAGSAGAAASKKASRSGRQSVRLTEESVNGAKWKRTIRAGTGSDPAVLKTQVLLARASFSPGVIDAGYGGNLKKALVAFQKAHDLTPGGAIDRKTWEALTEKEGEPVLTHFKIQPANVKGPFVEKIPTSFRQMAKLPRLGYTSPVEALAEKFHTSESLLKRLNPGADFKEAGTDLVVPNVGGEKPEGKVARIVVDKKRQAVRAYGKGGKLLGFFPATVGSGDFPSPSGSLKVTGVAPHPVFTYSGKLDYAKKAKKKTDKLKKGEALKIAAGPNNPVGSVWIDLNKPGYGIHGTPRPELISKRQSHGCVRLTNWDAQELAGMVHRGVPVTFSGGGEQAKASGVKGKVLSAKR
jgi:lipoprotein-anchoring transpeptidase ErfK/SrfK